MIGKRQKEAGLTLLEIMIALLILGAIVAPAYSVLTSSRRTMIAARDLSVAVSMAGSFMAALHQADPKKIPHIDPAPGWIGRCSLPNPGAGQCFAPLGAHPGLVQ